MADRSLRGMRLGSQSMQSEEGVVFSDRQVRKFLMPNGETFSVTFAGDAELPDKWTDPKTGIEGILLEEDGSPVHIVQRETKPARTHWDMLLERRTRAELEELLEERLQYLRARRGKDRKAS